jgi:hypothetical protein
MSFSVSSVASVGETVSYRSRSAVIETAAAAFGNRHPFRLRTWAWREISSPVHAGLALVGSLGLYFLGVILVSFAVCTTCQLRLIADDLTTNEAA